MATENSRGNSPENSRENTKATLPELRLQLDEITDELVALFMKRFDIIDRVAEAKRETGFPVFDKTREDEIIRTAKEKANDNRRAPYVERLFLSFLDIYRGYQRSIMPAVSENPDNNSDNTAEKKQPGKLPLSVIIDTALARSGGETSAPTIAVPGAKGAFSHEAAAKMYPNGRFLFRENFDDVFTAVKNGETDYGVVPIENSSFGSVNDVYDLMKEGGLHICRGLKLSVSQNLLAKPGTKLSDIREIVSHQQALGQSREFLRKLPGVKITEFPNTALAARFVSESDPNEKIAAVASAACAELYGLEIVAANIETNKNNFTRFISVGKEVGIKKSANRISIMMTLRHEPGSLFRLLSQFAALGVNLQKLESRPLPGTEFRFLFYFDFEAAAGDGNITRLLSEIAAVNDSFVFLGWYESV